MLDIWLRQERLELARIYMCHLNAYNRHWRHAALAHLLLHAYVMNVCQSEKPMLPYMELVTPKMGLHFLHCVCPICIYLVDCLSTPICGIRQCWDIGHAKTCLRCTWHTKSVTLGQLSPLNMPKTH